MEKEIAMLLNKEEEDREEGRGVLAPCYFVKYMADFGDRHIAMVKDRNHVEFLKERYTVLECKFIEK